MIPYQRAVCYSGYREHQSPQTKIYPSEQEVLEDLTLLSKYFSYIRMYDPYQHAQTVLKVIDQNKLPLKLILGVEPKGEISNPDCPWGGLHSDQEIEENKINNYKQLDLLASLCNQYPEIILAAAVGNENTSDWHHNLMPAETIAAHATYLKSKVKCPVTFCEGAHYWRLKGKVIAEAVDFISIHSYPLWLKIPFKDAYKATVDDYLTIQAMFPKKQIIFTEYGWTTSADESMNREEANEKNQLMYLKKMDRWSMKNQVPMFIFEAFDEPWKGSSNPDEQEKHWGILDVKRNPKLYFSKLKPLKNK